MTPSEPDVTQNLVQLVRSNQSEWKPLQEPGVSGIQVKALRFDAQSGRAPTFLLKFDACATYPAHDHPAREKVFVLEGEVHFGKHHLVAGDYLYKSRTENMQCGRAAAASFCYLCQKKS